MANRNLLTTNAKVIQSELMYYYPTLKSPEDQNVFLASIYCFLGKVGPWTNDQNPPVPTDDMRSVKNIFKNMFVLKKLYSKDVSPVLRRVDWTSGVAYDSYSDTVNMFATDTNGYPKYNFYVKNQYDQLFKCLWNNNSTTDIPQYSTVEPYFEPGTYSTNNIFQGADGYKWKYIATVDTGLKVQFMDDAWIPLPPGSETIGIAGAGQAIGAGDIEVINVTNGGSGYDPGNSAITVTVTGDGSGATGTAVVSDGVITDIVVTKTGSNYTYADVTITSSTGSGATAIAPVSPPGGHGSDPTSELGAVYTMFICEFNGSEETNGVKMLPTDIEYYQTGLVIDPSDYDSAPDPASGAIYQLSTNLAVAAGFGAYTFDEQVYQGDYNNPTFTATVLSFDQVTNVLYLINTTGTITVNAPIYGASSKTTRTLMTYSTPNIVPYTGYLIYVENRSGVTRSSDGIEQFKFVLGY